MDRLKPILNEDAFSKGIGDFATAPNSPKLPTLPPHKLPPLKESIRAQHAKLSKSPPPMLLP